MASWDDKLKMALEKELSVYYFASSEPDLLAEAAVLGRRQLVKNDEDSTLIEGPAPNLDEAIQAAGVLSFLGGRRLVELREISPASMGDKEAEELAALFEDLENAVLLVTALYKDKRTATSKKAKRLFSAADKAGFALELQKPTRGENLDFLRGAAADVGASFEPGADATLLERAGSDRFLLKNETEKLAAICGYSTISTHAVETHSVHNIEADVFELLRLLTGGSTSAALAKLSHLAAQRHEPVAIAGALAGGFVDMLRLRYGEVSRRSVAAVFSDMGYTGSDWRLKKARENAACYSTPNLEQAVLELAELDSALKSSAFPDKQVLLQAAVAHLVLLRDNP